jgi:hypothetical protein
MLIDSGPSVNVIDLETYHRLKAQRAVKFQPLGLRIRFNDPAQYLGTISSRVKCNTVEILAKFVVVNNRSTCCLLGRQTGTTWTFTYWTTS